MNRANVAFSDELTQLKAAKAMTLASINAVNRFYGDNARNEQELIAHIADMVMDVYAMESSLLRTQRILTDRGIEQSRVQADITRVFARDGAIRVENAARAVAGEVEDEKFEAAINMLTHRSSMKAIAARRRIADAVINAGRYPLS
jgi:hypothetical protein